MTRFLYALLWMVVFTIGFSIVKFLIQPLVSQEFGELWFFTIGVFFGMIRMGIYFHHEKKEED